MRRVYFYSHEPNEPPHIHVDRERFAELERIVQEHKETFQEAWREYFGA